MPYKTMEDDFILVIFLEGYAEPDFFKTHAPIMCTKCAKKYEIPYRKNRHTHVVNISKVIRTLEEVSGKKQELTMSCPICKRTTGEVNVVS